MPGVSVVMTSGAPARRLARNCCASLPPARILETYSAAVGILKLFGWANTAGATCDASMTAGDSDTSISLVVMSSATIVTVCSSAGISCTAEAATSVMTAPENAGTGTMLSSSQSAAVTTMTPSLSYLNFVGLTPTDTESRTPSEASCSASSPAAVLAILAANIMPSGVSTRSVTTPTGCVASWYKNSLGAFPSVGSAPASNRTSVPSVTWAATP